MANPAAPKEDVRAVLINEAGVVQAVGGGTQYAAGDAAATPTGTCVMWDDAGTQRAASAAKPLPVTATVSSTDDAQTSGGCSNFHLVSAGSDNATRIKASAGQVYGIRVFNNAAYPVYVKLHDTAANPPTAGSGVVKTVGVQAGTQRDLEIPKGMVFSTGIGVSIVKGITDASTTAVVASDCVIDVEYK